MGSDRWERLEQIYHQALDRSPAERSAFLEEACAGDDALRQEVDSLIAAFESAGTFIETAPLALMAAVFADKQWQPMIGRTLGRHRLLSMLGVGGMGEVYLAYDMQLGRNVALKLLPQEFTADRERVQRFKQEARAVSSLNHPNIVTVFEIGQIEDLYFIATEYIEGKTLRQRMNDSSMLLSEALEIVIQTANALTAAHEAGIVHRDIKPENIMLRKDGYVKVLDFGLAKLIAPIQGEPEPAAGAGFSTTGQVFTEPGKIVGTPRYMSPEHIRGQDVDARADIFSLGVMLYEMVAARPPFEGATASEVVAAILHLEAPPLRRFSPGVPNDLERIVEKALCKDRKKRYQHIQEVHQDLKDFKEEFEFEARLARAQRTSSQYNTLIETPRRTAETPSQQKGSRRWLPAVALTALLLLAGALGWFFWKKDAARTASFRMEKIVRLATAGKAERVGISPDGKEIAYSRYEAGLRSLWLRQVNVDTEIQIVPPENAEYHGISFSHDGNFIYYVRREQDQSVGVLYIVPKLGGSPRRLLSKVDSPITFSPDHQQIAFVRRNVPAAEYQLMVANQDGSGERMLAARRHPDVYRMNGPSWSPDGTMIACPVEVLNDSSAQTVLGVRVADGKEVPLTTQKWGLIGQVAWLADGTGLLVLGSQPQERLMQVWCLDWPGGGARKITQELSPYYNLSLTADSKTLATMRGDRFVNLWVVSDGDVNRAVQITTGPQREDGIRGLNWSPDGRIVYRSFANGNPNVWIVEADGSKNRQLSTDARQNLDPVVSPDGSFIAWTTDQSGVRNIWRMAPDGSQLQQLTHGRGEWSPQFTPDGKWMVYDSLGTGLADRLVWKRPLVGGPPIQLTDRPSYLPSLSPDGKLIVCNYRDKEDGPIHIAVLSLDGGPPVKIFETPGDQERPLRFTPDGRSVAYIVTRDGVSNLWTQPLTGGPPKSLTDFKTLRIFNFAWSRDGRRLVLSRGETTNDVVLITADR